MNKKYFVLAGLTGLLVILIVHNIKKSDPKRVSVLTYKTGAIGGFEAKMNTELPGIKKELLRPPLKSFKMGKKAIFDPLEFARKKRPLPVKPQPEPISKPEPLPVSDSPIERDVARFVFLGFLEAGKVTTIFLSKDDDIIIVKEGDKIVDDYIVRKITDDNIVITSLDNTASIEINLVENEPLRKK